MITHNVPIKSFLSLGGAEVSADNDKLHMTATTAVNNVFIYSPTPIKSYIYLPEKYKLPFRIDMSVKIDSPSFF